MVMRRLLRLFLLCMKPKRKPSFGDLIAGLLRLVMVALGIFLVSSLTGCVGYVDGGYGGYGDDGGYDGGSDIFLFGGNYDRGRDVQAYSHRGSESRSAAA